MAVLATREDLRHAFVSAGGEVNVRGLEEWSAQYAEHEFGLDKLMKRGREFFVGEPSRPDLDANGVLRAVVEANPLVGDDNQPHLLSLLDRIADVEQIDLVIIGSNHPSNVVSFSWFIDEVFLKYLAPKEHNLFVVGTVCKALTQLRHRNIFALGRCARLGPMLEASTAGSGSPIKTIPALALNGAVTMTDHVARAFRLSDYGIPAFVEPDEFAGDLLALLEDQAHRKERRDRAARYVKDNLDFSSYARFWGTLLDRSAASRDGLTGSLTANSSAEEFTDAAF